MGITYSGSEVVQMAIEAEEVGVHFYESLAEATPNREARDALTRIAQEEKAHLCELERLLDAVHGYRPSLTDAEAYQAYFMAVVKHKILPDEQTREQMARDMHDGMGAAKLAAEFERKIIVLLQKARRCVPELQRSIVDRLLEGEYEHLKHFRALADGQEPLVTAASVASSSTPVTSQIS